MGASPGDGGTQPRGALGRDLRALLVDWAERAVAGDGERPAVPGVVFAVAGRERLRVCRGLADPVAGRAMGPETSFHLGSLGKPLATLGILRLCTERGWSLDTPVMDLISSWSFDEDQASGFDPRAITIRHVLSHRAGPAHGRYRRLRWKTPVPPPGAILDGAMGRNTRLRLVNRPGTTTDYTAFGFPLLELVIEDQTGERFPRWMRRNVIEPLAGAGVDYVPNRAMFERLAVGHRERGAAVRPCRTVFASSGLFGRPMALARLLANATCGAAIDKTSSVESTATGPRGAWRIDPAFIHEMLSPQGATATGDTWGLGVMLSPLSGRPGYRHGGWLRGWFSIAQGFPADGLVVVISSNSLAFKRWARAMMRSVGALVAEHAHEG